VVAIRSRTRAHNVFMRGIKHVSPALDLLEVVVESGSWLLYARLHSAQSCVLLLSLDLSLDLSLSRSSQRSSRHSRVAVWLS